MEWSDFNSERLNPRLDRGWMQPPPEVFEGRVKTAARSPAKFGIAYGGNPSTYLLKILGPGDLRSCQQVTKRGRMSGSNFNYLYAPVPLTVADTVSFTHSGYA